MRQFFIATTALLTATVLSACGGGGSDGGGTISNPPPPARGDLLESPPAEVSAYSTSNLLAMLNVSDFGQKLLQLAYTPKCGIDVRQLKYRTVDPAGNITPASGALMVPTGTDAGCHGALSIVMYAHGTSVDRGYNIANLQDPDNDEGLLMAAVFAAQGYIVVAPNYVGYDSSTLNYHPYLIADQQSKDMIDALKAARTALPLLTSVNVSDGGKLFITGYSQGGYVAMATHSAMQTAGIAVTASAPMSGPYALSAFGDAVFQGQVEEDGPINATLLISAYQHAYGNLYSQPTDLFEPAYATGIDTLLPSTTDISVLESQGKIPPDHLFNSTPPSSDPAFAGMTPATQPANLATIFAAGFGTDNLITNSFRLNYLQDANAHPDGGYPTTTDGLPPASPQNPLRQALKTNDLRNWSPNKPVLLCAGNSDPTVFYLNTQLMQAYWAANAPPELVTVLDIDSPIVSNDPYAGLKTAFIAAKTVVHDTASGDGDLAVLEAYHASLVPPFCLTAAKAFFDAR